MSPADSKFLMSVQPQQAFSDSLAVLRFLAKALSQAQFRGFLLAEINNLHWGNGAVSATLNLNKQYHLTALANGNVDPVVLQQSGYRERLFNNVPFDAVMLQDFFRKLLSVYEDNGYPFASVYLDSIELGDGLISARIFADKNRFFSYDTLTIAGNVNISSLYLQSYLDMKIGSPYSEAVMQNLNLRLTELAFAESIKSSEATFAGDKVRVAVFLNKKNADQFDGVLGFLPNNKNGKLQLTGDVTLKIQNAFKRAEVIGLNFKGLPQQSRSLDLALSVPRLFSSPLGLNMAFNLYRQDTSYQNVNFKASVTYRLNRNNTLQFFADQRSGAIVSTQSLKNLSALPSFADVNTTFYGLGAQLEKLNYSYNPTSGYRINADASAGRKHVEQNTAINAGLYKNLALNSAQYRLQGRADIFVPIGKAATVNLANQFGFLIGNDIFDNEAYRLGGFKDLRGFSEQSILADVYTFFNAEYRYLLERNSYLFLFVNQAFVIRHTAQTKNIDYPLGFGSGISLETKAGIVSLSYALGKQHNIPVSLQNGKIHFGIIALF